MEAKGQWARPLPSEGGGLNESTYHYGCGTPPYQGVDAASAPGVGRGRRRGDCTIHFPLSPLAPAQAFLSPLAQVRGCGRNSVGIQGPYLFLLPFLGAAWAKPLPPRLGCQPHTGKVEPLDGTIRVVTANHLSIGDLVTKAIGGFVGIHRHIQHIRGVDTAKGH